MKRKDIINMQALGAYLKRLRIRAGMSQEKLAGLLGATTNTIWRIESGKQEPKTTLLIKILMELHGRIEDVSYLSTNASASYEEADALAEQAVDEFSIVRMANTDPQRVALLRRIAQLSDDALLVARIQGYLDRIEEE